MCQRTEDVSSIGPHGSGLFMTAMGGPSSRVGPRLEEGAKDDFVPICCFCLRVRDEKNMEGGTGSWVELKSYAFSRQLPLNHRFVFTHGYCPECVAHFDERMAAYRPTTVGGSLKETGQRLFTEIGEGQHDVGRSL